MEIGRIEEVQNLIDSGNYQRAEQMIVGWLGSFSKTPGVNEALEEMLVEVREYLDEEVPDESWLDTKDITDGNMRPVEDKVEKRLRGGMNVDYINIRDHEQLRLLSQYFHEYRKSIQRYILNERGGREDTHKVIISLGAGLNFFYEIQKLREDNLGDEIFVGVCDTIKKNQAIASWSNDDWINEIRSEINTEQKVTATMIRNKIIAVFTQLDEKVKTRKEMYDRRLGITE